MHFAHISSPPKVPRRRRRFVPDHFAKTIAERPHPPANALLAASRATPRTHPKECNHENKYGGGVK
jgi:hypothetical protein